MPASKENWQVLACTGSICIVGNTFLLLLSMNMRSYQFNIFMQVQSFGVFLPSDTKPQNLPGKVWCIINPVTQSIFITCKSVIKLILTQQL